MVTIATKNHVAHEQFTYIQKFHSILESYLIKWKDTVKKQKNKTKQQKKKNKHKKTFK